MPRRRDETELARADAIDVTRTMVRLKHRIEMRHELNNLEADLNKQFDEAIVQGKPFELDAGQILESLDEG